jgi:thioredoxin-related protein
MRNPRVLLYIIFFSLLLYPVSIPVMAAKPQIKWYAYEEGIAQSRKEAKKVLIYFYNDRCPACGLMNRNTLSNAMVIRKVNQNFIAIRINTDKQKSLANKYYAIYLPMTLFISDNGDKIKVPPGYYPPRDMMVLLDYIHTDSYQNMSIHKFMKNRGLDRG